jgi:hypothetical protein
MLFATFAPLEEHSVAEVTREICAKLGVPAGITTIAADIAVDNFRQTGSRAKAIEAGTNFISRVKRSGPPEQWQDLRCVDRATTSDSAPAAGRFTRTILTLVASGLIFAAFAIAIYLVRGGV